MGTVTTVRCRRLERVREDFQKLDGPFFGPEATKENRERYREISDTAGKLLRATISLIDEGKMATQ